MTRRAIVLGMACVLLLASCSGDTGTGGEPSPRAGVSGEVLVSAASSLTDAFAELGKRFSEDNPGAKVVFNFGGSSALVAQIREGAPADVFASADTENMDKLVEAGRVDGEPVVFARNKLRIVVRAGNPKEVKGLADLGRDDLTVVLCASQVPCGTLSDRVLAKKGVEVKAASREENVRAVLTKVALGEADAGIVYVTDALSAGGEILGIPIIDADNVEASYPIAVLTDSTNAAAARAFVAFVVSSDGAKILKKFEFLPPS